MPESVQLSHKTWPNVVALLGKRIAEANCVRVVDDFTDTCGEAGPYIEVTILDPKLGSIAARHGDWIVKDDDGEIRVTSTDPS